MPLDDAHESLETWSAANPLVRHTFIWQPNAGLIPPPDGFSTSFLRSYPDLFAPRAYWEKLTKPKKGITEYWNPPAESGQVFEFEMREEPTPRQALKQIADTARMANIAQQRDLAMSSHRASATEQMESQSFGYLSENSAARSAPSKPVTDAVIQPPRVIDSGWIPFLENDPMSAIAWVELQPGGEVRGAEVALDSVVSRMLAVLPSDSKSGDVFYLLDQNGDFFTSEPEKLSPQALYLDLGLLLPGWKLVANSPGGDTTAGRSFFLLSSLLLGVLLIAILSGGSLLMLQAHRHQLDSRQKSSFVSNVSHELKTPLTTIRMYAELIGEGRIRDETKQRNYLNVIITESHRLTRLINNVLDFSRLEQSHKPMQLQTHLLPAILVPVLDAQEIRLQQAGLTLIRDFPAEDTTVLTDSDALEQVILNLIDNALKYASTGGELSVQQTSENNRTVLHFMDRGPGIDPKQQSRLFQKFSRGDTSLTAAQPGCGLGLHLARRLLRTAHGDLTYNPRPGGGANFTITLPKSPIPIPQPEIQNTLP